MLKKIGILIEEIFDEQELIYPYHRLREDYEVVLIGSEKDVEYSSKAGVKFKSQVSSSDIKASELDGLVIPGGFSPDYMRRNKDTVALVSEMYKLNKPIAAICHGPWVLASAIDLKDKEMTSFFSIKDDLINAGAKWLDQEVVICDNIITSRNPKDLPVFMKEFIKTVG